MMNGDLTLAAWLVEKGYPLLDEISIKHSFTPAVQVDSLIFVSSATPLRSNGTEIQGKVGSNIDLATAKEAACLCLVHSLSLLRIISGDPLDNRIVRAVDLTFFINSIPTFEKHSEVADAGSRLLIDALKSKGEHSRSAIGVESLVRNVSIVLKAIYQVKI